MREEIRETPMLNVYVHDFGLKIGSLSNKRILDLGAGSRRFAFDCLAVEVNKEVWSLDGRDPWYAILRMIEIGKMMKPDSLVLELWLEVGKRSVEGTMERLPFGDGTFDLVLSRDALTHVFNRIEPMRKALSEAVRILRIGGEVRIFPGWLNNWTMEEKTRVERVMEVFGEIAEVEVELVEVARWFGGREAAGVMIVMKKMGL